MNKQSDVRIRRRVNQKIVSSSTQRAEKSQRTSSVAVNRASSKPKQFTNQKKSI